MDMAKLDRVCAMYAAGRTVKEIAFEVGVSAKMVWLYLARARDLGDVRARHRRVRGEGVARVMMDAFEASDGGYLGMDDFRMLLWGGLDVPATWRTVVRVGVSDVRKRFGVEIKHDRVAGGYRLVR